MQRRAANRGHTSIMKYFLLFFLATGLLSCEKDYSYEAKPGLPGKWVINAVRYPLNRPSVDWADHPHTHHLVFHEDGRLEAFTLQAVFHLMAYNRYQLLPNNTIRFYSTASSGERLASYELENELVLTFPNLTGFVWSERYQRF